MEELRSQYGLISIKLYFNIPGEEYFDEKQISTLNASYLQMVKRLHTCVKQRSQQNNQLTWRK